MVWVGYPQSNAIEMTSVHGITVFGGTFPAEIWHSLYSGAEVPCEEFAEPKQPISWAPFYGQLHRLEHRAAAPTRQRRRRRRSKRSRRAAVGEATGGYNPDAYAPGAGQEPTPVPPPPPEYGTAAVGGGNGAGGGS